MPSDFRLFRPMMYRYSVVVEMPDVAVTFHVRSSEARTEKRNLFHVILCPSQLEVRHFVEPLALLVPLESFEIDTVGLWLETVEHADGDVEISDLLAIEAAEVRQKDTGDGAVANQQYVISHALQLDDDGTQTVDHIQIAFATRARVAVV